MSKNDHRTVILLQPNESPCYLPPRAPGSRHFLCVYVCVCVRARVRVLTTVHHVFYLTTMRIEERVRHETEFFLLFREIYWNFVDTVIKRIGQVSRVPWYSGYRRYLFNAINRMELKERRASSTEYYK